MLPSKHKQYFYILTHHLETDKNIKVVQKPGIEDAWYPALKALYASNSLEQSSKIHLF